MRILALSTLAIVVLALARGLFYYTESVLAARVGQEVVLGLRQRLFAHLQRLPLGFHAQRSTGDLLLRLTGDITMLRDLLVASLLSLLSEVVVVVGYLTVMFLMDWHLALLATLATPVLFGLVSVYSDRIRQATRQQRRREGEVAGRLHQTLSGIHVVQLFAREDMEDARLKALNRRSLKSGLRTTRLEAQLNRVVELTIALVTALTLCAGVLQVMAGQLTAGGLLVFVAYMRSFYRPLRRIAQVAQRSSKAASCTERITEVLDTPSDVPDGAVRAPGLRGEILFEDVSFAYNASLPVLQGIDLQLRPGQTVALVGPSGAGKSTLAGLIPRLYDPVTGVVRIDGRDIREFTLKSLRDQISLVPQDGMLFGGDIGANIAYGKPNATDAEVVAAARAACIHDFIQSLPQGYDSLIGERGVTLSGGQRQRLAIARAIIKDAPIIILDEPTTGLDAESEQLVMRAMERLLAGRTAIVIAHRLATICRADLILVLENGRIVERGDHAGLMARSGRYRRLYALQSAEATPRWAEMELVR
jgi:ABC-type multidrug transport system fused ATPase/permease subunit